MMNRHWVGVIFCLWLGGCQSELDRNVKAQEPNFLFIAIDDLNDWVGCLGGHPQAKTPNIDRLASQGVLFANAHCQSPVCNPSRASLMTGLYPSTTGIYFLNPDIEASLVAKESKLMPHRFEEEGYEVMGAGKLFHNGKGINERYIPHYGGQFGGFGPLPEKKISTYPGHPLWDWGVYPEKDEDMPDFQIAQWAMHQLTQKKDRPWWMGVGFYRPHVPQYVPQKWFDLYPIDSIQLPAILGNDLDDLSRYGIDLTRLEHVSPPHEWVIENDAWRPMVQSYLACVSFVDAQVGKVIMALEESAYAENTYIVLWSDHGFHIGEKERHAKRSLWRDGTRVPLIIVGPNIAKGKICEKPVALIDIYPTLLDLAGLSPDSLLEGQSIKPLLDDSSVDWPFFVRSCFGPGNYAIISEKYRYIQYKDGTEEFYNHQEDPNEWHNLIDNEELKAEIQHHAQQIPTQRHPILGQGSTGHKAYEASGLAH